VTDRLAVAVHELVEALREAARAEAATVPPAPDRLLSVDEAAALLGLGRSLTYGEIAAGRLRSVKAGRRRLIPAAAVAEYIAGLVA
jgi:excisionase family DNA binding protein